MKLFLGVLLFIWIHPRPAYSQDSVILLHGLIRDNKSMAKIEAALQDKGYQTVNISYPSTKQAIETLAEDTIKEALSKCPKNTHKVHFVTHSLGGILVRHYLSNHTIENLGRIVMLGPPNNGSELVDRLKHMPCFIWINGPAGLQLGTDSQSVPVSLGPIDYEVGIIAGSRSFNPLFSAMLPNQDDSRVTVESTKLTGMNDHMTLPVTHTLMTFNNTVIEQTKYFLQHGYFDREGHIPDQYPTFSSNAKRMQSLSISKSIR